MREGWSILQAFGFATEEMSRDLADGTCMAILYVENSSR